MKIVTVVGARPQFIKAGVVSRSLMETGGVTEVLVHTGQHYDAKMSDIFFEELGLSRPDYALGIGSASHGEQTGRMLEATEKIMMKEKPDWVIVYGDTNSTLAGALAASKLQIPLAHVEAGLRSFNRRMPEESNRVLTDHLADLLFVPTETAATNLAREGIPNDRVVMVGDVMQDAALYYAERAEAEATILDELSVQPKQYILATVHRAENTDDRERLRAIISGIRMASEHFSVVLPLHPRTRAVLEGEGWLAPPSRGLQMIDPIGYLQMVLLEKYARLIVTDSGGVQKEAFFHGVPCLTIRDETEWVELVEHGWNRLLPPTSAETVASGILQALESSPPSVVPPLYGDGNAGRRIAARLSPNEGRYNPAPCAS